MEREGEHRLTRNSKRTEKQIVEIQATCDKKRLDVSSDSHS